MSATATLEAPSVVPDAAPPDTRLTQSLLYLNDVKVTFDGYRALRCVSLRAEPSKVTAVLGRNGVGKTSLVRAIVGQQPIAKGSITLGEDTLTKLSPNDRARRGVAFVPQGREIFPLLTVKENLETGFAP